MSIDRRIAALIASLMMPFSALAEPAEWAAFGRPGQTPDRVVTVTATEMAYVPARLAIRRGQTIKFVVTNRGRLGHEFVIGDAAFQHAHQQEMAAMPDMDMAEPNALDLAPGETKSLVWQFTRAGQFSFACDIPGHADAGMTGRIEVR